MRDNVEARHFYKDAGDKIKQNWALYEYANILFSTIAEAPKLASYRKKHGKDDIAAFCVYFSKRLRRSIAHANEERTPGIVVDARYIYEFYPKNTKAQTEKLLYTAAEALDEHVEACAICPHMCLSEGFELTDMFDSLEETGWPTR